MSASGRTERWLVSGSVTCRSGFLKIERSSRSAVSGAPRAVQGLRLRICMAGCTDSIPGWGTNIPGASPRSWKKQCPPKSPTTLPAVLLAPSQLAFLPQGDGRGVLSRGEHWPRSVDHVTRVPPLKAGGGGGEGSPGTSPLQELRDDWDRGICSLRGKGGKKTSVCYPQADSRWDSSENLELT